MGDIFQECEQSLATSSWRVDSDPELAKKRLHAAPFIIKHGLVNSPLFEPQHLISMAKKAQSRPGDAYIDAGDATVTDKWGKIPVPDMPVEQIISRIEHAKAWVILKHVEKDSRYAAVLREFALFVWDLAGPVQAKDILNPEMLVIVSSPHRITPFHFDAEINFLVQVRGTKEVWICDPTDRSILSEEEVEEYYAGNTTVGQFKPEFEAKAKRVVLHPGDGVHIPTHAAHWVKNGDDISVSLSLNFEFPPWRANVYKANRALRKLGMKPTPPGVSPTQDVLKHLPMQSLRLVKKTIKSAVKS